MVFIEAAPTVNIVYCMTGNDFCEKRVAGEAAGATVEKTVLVLP
jgi:hypothetical protein